MVSRVINSILEKIGGSSSRTMSIPSEEVNFDHFQVLRAIGKGSFGKVCIVRKGENSGKMYAMKYAHKVECAARGALRNMAREVEIMAQLEHPFLVNLWFSFQDEEDFFMVTDLLLGGDLRYHLQQQVRFSEESVLLFIAELALALDYLRSKHIIHRDIKPDNVLLDDEGHAHLTDFNVATILEGDSLATSISGTKPYIAPEIYMSCRETCRHGYDYSVDWWSLGVLAWETLNGVRPFPIHSTTSYKEALHMLKSDEYRVPQSSKCSLAMSQLLDGLLTFEHQQRVTSLAQLRELDAIAHLDFEEVLYKKVKPAFTPPNTLNCDPTFELEEMIIETRPLHKKKKRLAKQRSLRTTEAAAADSGDSGSPAGDPGIAFIPEYPVYNRERELKQRVKEEKERQWEEELTTAMAEAEDRLRASSIDHGAEWPHNQHLKPSRSSASSPSVSFSNLRPSNTLEMDFIDASPKTSTS